MSGEHDAPASEGRPLTIMQLASALKQMADRYGDHPCYVWGGPIMCLNVIPTCDGEPMDGERKPNEFVIEWRE